MYWSTYGKITKNKSWEFECGRQKHWSWFDLYLRLSRKCDHSGLWFNLELFGFFIDLNIYDNRHWNYDTNRWYEPGEELKELEIDILEDYEKIKKGEYRFAGVKKFEDDESLSWEERFKVLERHHINETRSYINSLEMAYRDFEEYVKKENEEE